MALKHDFYLIPKTTDIISFWQYTSDNSKYIEHIALHDDLILYITDTLKWIPTKNPGMRAITAGFGINYHGVTLLDKHSAVPLRNIFSAWRDLFNIAPEKIELTGDFVGEDNHQNGEYERLILNRDEIVRQLEKVIAMSERLLDGEYYVYHCGV
ncbi:coproporphyrinogen III oxidase (plasmid) [Niallia taxi]|uniref:Coproporphyrinogen III oxidase n=1 Tax=Niallia taxi TaxID=2499688 RepID=A0A3S2X1I0_9BACI|nr:coproporphyrinogen III oxidase [Niallia taxi]MED4035945.1 coproporphyrinogen III oxidase [Niallia taxi]MED4057361.1 coproporphyrinogen III oxidase [Niallia taxi]MED4118856.1 coproporphyrinogen III oxidase [Niallia taxi]RVT60198.1 coproporphyrinogen III oxidase [Niallia taxi]